MSGTYSYIIDFLANNSQFVNAMNQNVTKIGDVENKVKSTQQQINGMMDGLKTFGAALGIAFSVGAVVEFAKSSAEAYNRQIQNETALLVALKGRVGAQQSLISQAKELEGKTLFSDEDTIRAQSLVAAFVKEESQIKRLIPAIQDFASAKQMDLGSATDMVTRAFNGEMETIGRTGIKIEGAGGSAERLTSIIHGLNEAYGGQAEAAAKVGMGALIQLGHEWENLKKTIGEAIVEQQNWSGSLTETLTGAVKQINEMFGGGFKIAPVYGEDRAKKFLGTLPKDIEDQRKLINSELIKLNEDIKTQQTAFNHDSRWNLFGLFEGTSLQNAKFDITVELEEVKNLKGALGALKSPNLDPAKPKVYEDTFNGLNEKLKDYNVALQAIAPNDTAAINKKLVEITVIEAQIAVIDRLKKAIEKHNAAVAMMTEDTKSGFRDDSFAPLKPLHADYNKIPNEKENYYRFNSYFDAAPVSMNKKDTEEVSGYTKHLDDMKKMLDINKKEVDSLASSWVSFGEKGHKVLEDMAKSGQKITTLDVALVGLNDEMMSFAESGSKSFSDYAKAAEAAALKVIDTLIAEGVAGAVKEALISVPFPINIVAAGLAAGAATTLFNSIIPSFETGGIVPGNSWYGDRMMIRVNSGEEVLTRNDPRHRMNNQSGYASGGYGGGQTIVLQPSIEFNGDRLRVVMNRVDNNLRKRT